MERPQSISSGSDVSSAPTEPTIYYLHSTAPILDRYQPIGLDDDTVFLLEKTYQHLLRDGQQNLGDDIVACRTDQELRELARHIDTALLRPMKASGGRTVQASPSPQAGFEDSIDDLLSHIDDPIVREQSRLYKECSRRDGRKCVVCGIYDRRERSQHTGVETGKLIAAHILPFALGQFSTHEELHTATIWHCLFRYFPDLRSRLNFHYTSLNDTRNVMLLWAPLHDEFGIFKLSFQPTDLDNQYRIHTWPGIASCIFRDLPHDRILRLASHDTRYELPNPLLLEVHHVIASILHVTGRAEIVENIQRDSEDIKVLANDGSTNITNLLSITSLSAQSIPDTSNDFPSRWLVSSW